MARILFGVGESNPAYARLTAGISKRDEVTYAVNEEELLNELFSGVSFDSDSPAKAGYDMFFLDVRLIGPELSGKAYSSYFRNKIITYLGGMAGANVILLGDILPAEGGIDKEAKEAIMKPETYFLPEFGKIRFYQMDRNSMAIKQLSL